MVWYKEIRERERERDMNGGVVGGLNIYRGGGGDLVWELGMQVNV